MLHRLCIPLTLVLLAACAVGPQGPQVDDETDFPGAQHALDPSLAAFPDDSGWSRSFTASGHVDTKNPFFQPLGSNGRSCSSCHRPEDGWSVTPQGLSARFQASGGLDPVFRPVDGAVSPTADVSSVAARQKAYALLLQKGLIRVGLPIPPEAEFTLAAVDDPYGYASARELSLFRRVLPASNVGLLSTVMWDGRESLKGQSLHLDLAQQAQDATSGHAQAATPLSDAQRQAIVDFETSLYSAQVYDTQAGNLTAQGGQGGPELLARQPFFPGINDSLGQNPSGAAFDPKVFTLYDAWAGLDSGPRRAARQAVARGQAIFNTRPIEISGVGGLNDELNTPVIHGTCTTCHDSPNVGHHSLPAPLNLGLADAARRTPDLPLYTLKNTATGQTVQTTDPGRALVTGRWKDIGRFKGPILRDLAARAPYFHNGSAASLKDVVDFYDTRFGLALTDQEIADLVAFLRTL